MGYRTDAENSKPYARIVQGVKMKGKLKCLKQFNWQLWFSPCALSLIPAVYQTVKTFLLSANGEAETFDIIGQMEWFDLVNETLQAFLIVPLYSILNKILKSRKEQFAESVFKTGAVCFIAYMMFSLGVLIYGSKLISVMNPGKIAFSVTNTYLRLETIAFMIAITVSFFNVVFVVVGKSKNIYIFLALRTILSVIADFLLIPNFSVYGAAISNIIVNTILAAASFLLLYADGYIKLSRYKKTDIYAFREWCRTGVFSGLQQFIDNFIYAVMICRMMNLVAEQGNYWIANNFIWGWLLLPISALAEVIKSDCKVGYKNLKQSNYYFISGAVVILWALSIPGWMPFFQHAQKLSNANEIFDIVLKLSPFYIAYAGYAIIDNIFIGLGKTTYNAVNSVIINLLYYGIFYVLYLAKAIVFNMDAIVLMFGFGMVVHWIVSIIQEKLFFKKYRENQEAG